MGSLWHPFAPMAHVAEHPFVVVRGEGAYVFDEAGRRYLDGTASLWYANIGYGRSEVADAVARQMETLHAYHLFVDFATPPARNWPTGSPRWARSKGARCSSPAGVRRGGHRSQAGEALLPRDRAAGTHRAHRPGMGLPRDARFRDLAWRDGTQPLRRASSRMLRSSRTTTRRRWRRQ